MFLAPKDVVRYPDITKQQRRQFSAVTISVLRQSHRVSSVRGSLRPFQNKTDISVQALQKTVNFKEDMT